jgi:hypothetical protein
MTTDAVDAVSERLQLQVFALFTRRCVGLVLVVTKMRGTGASLMPAVTRGRTPRELQRQDREKHG